MSVATPLAEGQALNPQDGAGAGNPEGDKYVISIKQVAKFVVGLGDRVSPTDVEEGMRVGWVEITFRVRKHCRADPRSVDRTNYKIMIPLPPKIDPSVTMMQVEERPSITYADVGGCKEQIEKLREVVELPLLEVGRGVRIDTESYASRR
jgi:26S proteasome regulatory subunit T1